MNQSGLKWVLVAVIAAVITIVVYLVLNAPDDRNAAEKIGDAIHELPQGGDKAARELQDRTPGERLEDAIQDKREDMEDNTSE